MQRRVVRAKGIVIASILVRSILVRSILVRSIVVIIAFLAVASLSAARCGGGNQPNPPGSIDGQPRPPSSGPTLLYDVKLSCGHWAACLPRNAEILSGRITENQGRYVFETHAALVQDLQKNLRQQRQKLKKATQAGLTPKPRRLQRLRKNVSAARQELVSERDHLHEGAQACRR